MSEYIAVKVDSLFRPAVREKEGSIRVKVFGVDPELLFETEEKAIDYAKTASVAAATNARRMFKILGYVGLIIVCFGGIGFV